MNQKRQRREFTEEFKNDAVRLVTDQGYSCTEVGRRLGVNHTNISRWVRRYRTQLESENQTSGSLRDLEDEVKRLRKENQRLLMEREILKNGLRSLYPPMITETLFALGGRGRPLIGVLYPLKNVAQE